MKATIDVTQVVASITINKRDFTRILKRDYADPGELSSRLRKLAWVDNVEFDGMFGPVFIVTIDVSGGEMARVGVVANEVVEALEAFLR